MCGKIRIHAGRLQDRPKTGLYWGKTRICSAGHDRIMHWLRSDRPSFKKINDNIVSEHQNVPTSVDEALRSVCRNIHNASPTPLPPALS